MGKPKFCSSHLHYADPSGPSCACGQLSRGVSEASARPAPPLDDYCQGTVNGYVGCGLRSGHEGECDYAPSPAPPLETHDDA